MRCERDRITVIAGALIALSCLCCHKVKSVNQLIETNIKYQALAVVVVAVLLAIAN